MSSEIRRLLAAAVDAPTIEELRLNGKPVAGQPGLYELDGEQFYSAALLDTWATDLRDEE